MADGNDELEQLRRSAGATFRSSELVALGTFCSVLLLLVVLAACGDGDAVLENGRTQATPTPSAAETRDAGGEATPSSGVGTAEP